jgi:hypothetical protein
MDSFPSSSLRPGPTPAIRLDRSEVDTVGIRVPASAQLPGQDVKDLATMKKAFIIAATAVSRVVAVPRM